MLSESDVMRTPGGELALRASRCGRCEKAVFPHSDCCPFCAAQECSDLPLDASATLYSFTRVRVAPAGWETPYLVGFADFDAGVRVFAKLDPDVAWSIGDKSRLRIEAVAAAVEGAPRGYWYHLGAA